jgi:hypothetical protein
VPVDSDTNTQVPESESQPTPPPRKKKLKKKLEVIVGQKLNEKLADEDVGDVNDKNDMEEKEADCDSKSVAIKSNDTSGMNAERGSPKKSRRKKKHLQ